jgi:hypothetical protein
MHRLQVQAQLFHRAEEGRLRIAGHGDRRMHLRLAKSVHDHEPLARHEGFRRVVRLERATRGV